jgi:hypothetical protein
MAESIEDIWNLTEQLQSALQMAAESAPAAICSPAAAKAFRSWLEPAKELSTNPQYFDDVALNFDIANATNKDLLLMFQLLSGRMDK